MCNILQEALNLNGSKDGKTDKLSYDSQIGGKYNNTGMHNYGEKDNAKNSNTLLQDKVHRNFIHPHPIRKLNGLEGGRQFDEMQLGKVGKGSENLQVCMIVNVIMT